MGDIKWTKDQQAVIGLRNRDILVSAAAGSGKTAVLVERIIKKVTDADHPIDIDQILVVTFTKAAAAEMKQRISAAIEECLEQSPDSQQLKRQASLIHAAQITTIDSFCLSIVKNYFHTIELEPGYRVADENECKIWLSNVLDELLEEKYKEASPAFLRFVETFAPGKSDERLAGYISRLYQFCVSHPWPLAWLEEQIAQLDIQTIDQLEETGWVKELMEETTVILKEALKLAEQGSRICGLDEAKMPAEGALAQAVSAGGAPAAYAAALNSDAEQIRYLLSKETYHERNQAFSTLSFEKLGRITKKDGVDELLQKKVKQLREQEKEVLKTLQKQFFFQDTQSMADDMYHAASVMEELLSLTMQFYQRFQQEKVSQKAMDFSDIEHYALDIFVSRQKDGSIVYSDVAKELRQQYEEIMIDEYQDSNLVQELILSAISGEEEGHPNRFMVGDVKQSIYKFRMARPELFMEKYRTYRPIKEGESSCQRIDLHQNFRSRKVVIDTVNLIFGDIMQESVGGVEYDEDARLNEGMVFLDTDKAVSKKAECLIVAAPEETEETKQQLEARAVAQKIHELCSTLFVWDKEEQSYRIARPGDIVILLRTMSGWSEEFQQVLSGEGIPCYSETRTGYFSAMEIQTVLNYLKLVDNPIQDVPMAAVLRSPIAGFTLDEMAQIRIAAREGNYAKAVFAFAGWGSQSAPDNAGENTQETLENADVDTQGVRENADEDTQSPLADKAADIHLKEKVRLFLDTLQNFREKSVYLPVHELIEEILDVTGYGEYVAVMPAGEQRSANLKALVARACAYEATGMKGLYSFNQYIEEMHKYEIDFGEAPLQEAGGAVRIMSIHKSKGLEFPIVFVCGMGKKFNEMDARASVVFHPELGVASDAVDLESRIKVPTLLKRYISHKLRLDNLGEELRVLYVALTRAKEKLIMTGMYGGYEKEMEVWDMAGAGERLDYLTITKAACYLDWVCPTLYKSGGGAKPVTLEVVTLEEQVAEEMKEQISLNERKKEFLQWLEKDVKTSACEKRLENALECQKKEMAEKEELYQIPVKYSVSELKENEIRELKEKEPPAEYLFPVTAMMETEDTNIVVPSFIKKEETLSGAARGTVYHKIMELIFSPYCENVPEGSDAKTYLAHLKAKKMLTKDEEHCINLGELNRFLKSELAVRMWNAKKEKLLYCEQPFVIGIPAREFKNLPDREELVMVQGIIDVFWQEGDGLMLLDYKTDHVRSMRELTERYKLQLSFYKQALEQATGKKVKKSYIYSFSLSAAAEVEIEEGL